MEGILSVSELTARIKGLLEGTFRSVRVEGEISNHKLYPSGHRYFSIKDEGAQVRVVLFRARERFVFGELKDGQTVVVTGGLGVYEKKGEYQIYAQSVEVRGIGSLLLELEKRKARFAAEGLFDAGRKRRLPAFPGRIGIVTSRQGAALRDMISVARKRWPAIAITLAPALVQGDGAAGDIAAALQALYARENVDVIIVGRGGGSVEDLWAFNEEPVVRAIAASPVPTISAVGHETDFTLADLVADHRAPTPTAAAQMAVPDAGELRERADGLAHRSVKAERNLREMLRREHRAAAASLSDPRPLLQAKRFAAVAAEESLCKRVREMLRSAREDVTRFSTSVRLHSPTAAVSRRRGDLSVMTERILRLADEGRGRLRNKAGVLRGKLAALDPKAVLSRGYAIVAMRSTGDAVRSVSEVFTGDPLEIRVSDGAFGAVADGKPAG